MSLQFEFGTVPYQHQQELFDTTKDRSVFGLLWEMGTGKTKATIDLAVWRFCQGDISGMLIIAPNGVHRNWVLDELPIHLPASVKSICYSMFYNGAAHKTKWHGKACAKLFGNAPFAVLSMSYDSIMTEPGRKLAKSFLQQRECLYVLDESHWIKSPGTKRTKRILASARYAKFRRILTGTPVAQGPFDLYAQIKFLDKDFWRPHGVDSFEAFKTKFGIYKKGYNRKQKREFNQLVGYRNVDKLNTMISPLVSRVVKDEVLDLPPKSFVTRYVDMTKEQWKLYGDLRDKYIAELDDGELVTAELAIVRLLRLQQIVLGYVPADDDEELRLIGGKNLRLDDLVDFCETLFTPTIIWCRFTEDINMIHDRLGDKATRYDGGVSSAQAWENQQGFKDGKYQFILANPKKGKEGLTWHNAHQVIYYSNNFSLLDRLQSEDRAHRSGLEHPVTYYDYVTPGTVDVNVINSLKSKFNIANQITGDQLKEWISA